MNKQNEKTPLWKETAKVLTKAEMLNEDELQQVTGGDNLPIGDCEEGYDNFCERPNPCYLCPYLCLERMRRLR